MKKRIFISTGEVSGDLQGSMLVTALLKKARLDGVDLEIVALGGDRMEAAGAHLLGNTIALSSIGLLEAVPYILPTLKMQRYAKQQLRENPPDLVILIDYIGANLGMGKFMRSQFPNCPIVYYIAPQEWVWSMNDKNTNEIVSITDRLLAIFPEEARYYKNQGASVTWVGHPLVDRLASAPSREAARKTLGIPPEEQAIVLSPASRKQELKFLMPTIFEAAQTIQARVPNAKFYIPLALDRYREAIESAVHSYGLNAKLISREDTQMAIAAADLAITKSGTVNLELALLNIPQVAIYRISRFTAWAGRNILKVKITFASPVNLVLMRTVVPELLQEEANVDRIVKESIALLSGPAREKVLQDYQEVQKGLGAIGVCDRAAIEIFALFC